MGRYLIDDLLVYTSATFTTWICHLIPLAVFVGTLERIAVYVDAAGNGLHERKVNG
jgi:hypothetical protein